MKKRLKRMLFLVVCVLFLGSGSVYAKEEGNVYDGAGLLTDGDIAMLNMVIGVLEEESGWNVYAVTTADAGGKTAGAYADDFFDTHSTEQEDGVTALIDMDNREIYISTCGEAIRYLTDERIESVLDEAYEQISEEDYAACLHVMILGIEKYYQEGIPSNQYNYDEDTGAISRYHSLTWLEIMVAIVVSVTVGILVYAAVVGKYRLKFGGYQYPFHDYGQVNLRVSDDRFLNQTVTHRRIPKQTSSGGNQSSSGRSTTHQSSSGRSHGGGGRHF